MRGNIIGKVITEIKRSDARHSLLVSTAFEPFLRRIAMKGERLLCHMMLMHEVKPTLESIKTKTNVFQTWRGYNFL